MQTTTKIQISSWLSAIPRNRTLIAGRGFWAKGTLGTLEAQLVKPAFTKGKNQLGRFGRNLI